MKEVQDNNGLIDSRNGNNVHLNKQANSMAELQGEVLFKIVKPTGMKISNRKSMHARMFESNPSSPKTMKGNLRVDSSVHLLSRDDLRSGSPVSPPKF